MTPSLTTVDVDLERVGSRAMTKLIAGLRDETPEANEDSLLRIIWRESTARGTYDGGLRHPGMTVGSAAETLGPEARRPSRLSYRMCACHRLPSCGADRAQQGFTCRGRVVEYVLARNDSVSRRPAPCPPR
ncbi:substrate-binding domain-containing protein [Streptomyces sp. NPDC050121]|uniref:substrate-binding domain-containing protein n=1 Tax=Streptomyces sp. NPDC050121 TaxID=3365601 RepID=UPI00379859AA